jgi:glycosyltransferase involved in cell wall biosynthesis
MKPRAIRILAYATLGFGSHDEKRLKTLLSEFHCMFIPFDRMHKFQSCCRVIKEARNVRPELIVQEGTGFWGGIALLYCRILLGIPYVVSSGDAVAPFLSQRFPWFSFVFYFYEKVLCKYCKGFIGWTPYLVGRAISLGARRGMTAEGFTGFYLDKKELETNRNEIRRGLGISESDIVYGLVGSLKWSKRMRYCYGMELVKAIQMVERKDVHVVIAGDGDGLPVLQKESGQLLGKRIHFLGRIEPEKTLSFLGSLDFGTIPQSCDAVGASRYTTKVSEYVAAGLPILTNQIPMAYDLNIPGLTILPGENPWDPKFINTIAKLMNEGIRIEITKDQMTKFFKAGFFDRESQIKRVTKFISDILN